MKQIKTQHTPLHRPQWALTAIAATLAAAGILGACTPEEEHVKRNNPIVLSAGPINGDNTALPLYFAFSEELPIGGYGVYGNERTGTRTAGKEVQPITNSGAFQDTYNVSGLRTKVTGWYPGGGTDTDVTTSGKGYYYSPGQTVTWTIDGTQDIIIAAAQEGSVANPIPPLVFKHCLTQILLHPYTETTTAQSAWGKITSIEVVNQPNTVKYNLQDDATGAVTFTGSANKTITLPSGGALLPQYSIANKDQVPQVGAPIMIAPKASGTDLTLRIYTANNEMKTITLNQELKAGTPYRLYLRFTERDITIEATITEWGNSSNAGGNLGNIRVGDYYYTDGTVSPTFESGNGKSANGVVYWVNSTDQRFFKVMALDQHTHLDWAASNAYVIGSDAQDRADGKGNSAAIKAYFDANTSTVGSDFKTAFPAAEYCYNYTGKGGTDAPGTWHLPSKDELQYLWCAYNGANPVTWDTGTAPAEATTNTTKQAAWTKLIKASGGTEIGDQLLWSSSESSEKDGEACRVSFSWSDSTYPISGTYYAPKKSGKHVRCVRNFAPPPASVGDYYYTDGTISSKLVNGKPIDGIVYYVDHDNPEKFKIFSLDDGYGLRWSALDKTYVLGFAGQSETDGKANVAAMKAYSANNKTNSDAQKQTTGIFATDFPAAEFCDKKNTGSVTGWYMPAKDELITLYTTYSTNQTVLDAAIATNNIGTVMAKSSWSSTEFNSSNIIYDDAWYVYLNKGILNVYNTGKSTYNYVRCIRDINLKNR